MTYTQAKLIIWNDASYAGALVREAAVFIIGSLDATTDDLCQAYSLI
jgi:hypothetical protein